MFSSTRPLLPSTIFPQTDIPTLPVGPAEDWARSTEAPTTTLSPSLVQDLQRFAADPVSAHLLPIVAASVRHGKALSVLLGLNDETLHLTLHPRRQVYYCDRDLCALPDESLSRIQLQRVEPDVPVEALFDGKRHIGSLRPLLWHLALRGAHAELLPELVGDVRCRVTLGISLTGLPVSGPARRLIQRMKSAPVSIDDLAPATPLTRAAIQRVWNALYLQSALMVSRGPAT